MAPKWYDKSFKKFTSFRLVGPYVRVECIYTVVNNAIFLVVVVLYTPVVKVVPSNLWSFAILPICFGVGIFFEIGSLVSVWVHSIPAAISISSILVVLFVYCSGTFFPPNFLPAWVNLLAPYTPFRALVDSVEYLTFGIGDSNTLLKGGFVIFCWFTILSSVLPKTFNLDK